MITTRQRLTRYSGSLAVVLGVHALAILLALNWSKPQPIPIPPQAMVVELAPAPVPPPPAPPKVVPTPQPPAPVEELPLPKLAEAPKPTISVPKPAKPKPKPQPPKPVVKPEPPKEKPSEEKPSDAPVTPSPSQQPAPATAGPSPAQAAAKANWQGLVQAHLAKHKRYPSEAQRRGKEGTNSLHFVVDAEGKVLSYELTSRSGNADLDRATLDMIRRAQPLPKPPADMLTNGTVEVTAPFNYEIDRSRGRR
ncbi:MULTISPECIES: energy transducer TonB [Pseudomonas]|uniref:Energy transducer TonB n=1 Tax=Pseudomonas protegens TaxID=380021 RepID=A0A7G8YGK7_9PSED|nr:MULTISPECIES: energy transducer TonB [Pseudomonas]RBJ83414.1 energy transducer TonB [Pseudomonas sp. MWU12-2534b]MDF2395181.1 TonB family protein [Pseudomonas sp. 3MA1]MDP9527886.1 energy transducer TonB [Pseudomonas protegens]QNH74807.1 energy transducer TonB [Pseudomonas protegens]QNL04001.1 energy transducer TonB [Pseudomonas protegens]